MHYFSTIIYINILKRICYCALYHVHPFHPKGINDLLLNSRSLPLINIHSEISEVNRKKHISALRDLCPVGKPQVIASQRTKNCCNWFSDLSGKICSISPEATNTITWNIDLLAICIYEHWSHSIVLALGIAVGQLVIVYICLLWPYNNSCLPLLNTAMDSFVYN